MLILGVSGHRDLSHSEDLLKGAFQTWCKDHEVSKVITGMALGFDTIVAEACVEMGIPFVAALPFATQAKIWNPYQQSRYLDLLEKASEIEVVSEGEMETWKYNHRNQWIVDNSQYLLAYLKPGMTKGGTADCWRRASSQKKERFWPKG